MIRNLNSNRMATPIIITLDGNIGAGKSTLLSAIGEKLPSVTVIPEPVGEWLTMKNEKGESLLELFYKDTARWAYTFQNCAILTRLLHTLEILQSWKQEDDKLPVIITERSILTDRYVFAEMLHNQGKIDDLEWNLYLRWFDSFAKDIPVGGIIHLTTSVKTSKDRIKLRDRAGEESIPEEYLESLDSQHQKWIDESHLPSLKIHTEPGTDMELVVKEVEHWIHATFLKKTN